MVEVKIYTTDFCPYCNKAKNILDKKNIDYEEINIHGSQKLRDEIEELTGRRDVPQIFIDGEHIGDDDALLDLEISGGLDKVFETKTEDTDEVIEEKLVIIGSGPAGLSAALYGARANLEPLIIAGNEVGGQLSITSDIENYPGFNGESAPDLINIMQEQAQRFGAKMEYDLVTEVDFKTHPFYVKTHSQEYSAKSVIICTGSSPRRLDVSGETEYIGKGVSYCATCDGFFFQNRSIVVVGGGDSAIEEAIFLTRFASEIYVVHRRDRLRANDILQEQAFKNEKINFIWDSILEEIKGDGNKVTSVLLKNVKTDEQTIHETEGVFIFIGHIPNTEIFKGQIELDHSQYIVTDKKQNTSVRGVFAAGDVQDSVFRQAITSAGTGAAAAIQSERFIAEIENRAYPGR